MHVKNLITFKYFYCERLFFSLCLGSGSEIWWIIHTSFSLRTKFILKSFESPVSGERKTNYYDVQNQLTRKTPFLNELVKGVFSDVADWWWKCYNTSSWNGSRASTFVKCNPHSRVREVVINLLFPDNNNALILNTFSTG